MKTMTMAAPPSAMIAMLLLLLVSGCHGFAGSGVGNKKTTTVTTKKMLTTPTKVAAMSLLDISRRRITALSARSDSSAVFTDQPINGDTGGSVLFNDGSMAATLQTKTMSSSSTTTLSPLMAKLTKIGMISFIAAMCIALPATLLPQQLLYRFGLITKMQEEKLALFTGQFCARWLFRLIPFCKVECNSYHDDNPQPSIWVCNHSSALDIFLLLANDLKLRGKNKRPIKIIYWKQLEDNPVTKLLFQQCGFIPVQMSANKAGEDNEYDVKSFKNMIKLAKKAFEEGFDVGILPEGQLNPTPEKGLLPVFPGAYTLAKMSRRPIQMMALHGVHQLWHPDEEIGMTVTGRTVKAHVYPHRDERYSSPEEFVQTFTKVVGEFGTYGRNLPDDELNAWLDGSHWKAMQQRKAEEEARKRAEEEEARRRAEEEKESEGDDPQASVE